MFTMPAYLLGEVIRKGFLQQIFPAPAADLEVVRHPRGPFDHFVIEEWRARLDRSCHRHTIRFDEQIARQIGMQIGIESLVEERSFGRVKPFCEQGLCVFRFEREFLFP